VKILVEIIIAMVVLSGSANGWAEIYQDFYCS